MQNYKADMHIHSCYSFDSTMPVKDIVDHIKIKDIILNFVENRIEKDICNA